MSAESSSPSGMSKRKRVLMGLALIPLFGLGLGALHMARVWMGEDLGGSCRATSDCKPGLGCISKRCYRLCKTDADCGSGWSCHPTDVEITGALGISEDSEMKICFEPKKE